MDTQEFVRTVEALPPSYDELHGILVQRGYDNQQIEMYLQYYYFTRKNSNGYIRKNDPIIELLENYDMKGFSIGYLDINKKAVIETHKIVFGSLGGDPVYINLMTGHIEVSGHDDDDDDEILFECAVDSAHFLAALVVAIEVFKRRSMKEIRLEDKKLNQHYAEQCSTLAGGQLYYDFFAYILNA